MKVVDEIRMVYDTTKSGLNDIVWAPWFTLPTIEAELRLIDSGTYMADCDAGFFLNFMLYPCIRSYVDVNFSSV